MIRGDLETHMSGDRVRNWLGIYVLVITVALGAYIILFQQTQLLPVSSADASSAFKIIIPTLLAQVTIVFKWFSSPTRSSRLLRIPGWVVKGPPIATTLVLLVTITYLICDQGRSDGGEIFKNAVTFCISVLSASTMFIIPTVFGDQHLAQNLTSNPPSSPVANHSSTTVPTPIDSADNLPK